MTTDNLITAEITNSCKCMYCDNCEVLFIQDYGDPCPECGTPIETHYGCSEACWEDMEESWLYLFELWSMNNNSDLWYVRGSNLGWMHGSGHSDPTDDAKKVLELMTFPRGDWTLRCTYDKESGKLTVVRSSHDEYGALLEVLPVWECNHCGENVRSVVGEWVDFSDSPWCDGEPGLAHQVTEGREHNS
jgi:hypothetical protein